NFLWKSLHSIHKCGDFWEKINGFEQRAKSPACDMAETLEHILTECQASGQHIVWPLCQKLLSKVGVEWSNVTWGSIIGCALANWSTPDGHRSQARTAFSTSSYQNLLISYRKYAVSAELNVKTTQNVSTHLMRSTTAGSP
ncbi:hypothetical protein BDQ17DRAFT_1482739, partial [Cyathus striatus]